MLSYTHLLLPVPRAAEGPQHCLLLSFLLAFCSASGPELPSRTFSVS